MNKAKAQFYRMLQSLAKAGLPMLRILAQPAPRKLKKAAARLRQAVESGMPLEEAMDRAAELYYAGAVRMFRFIKTGMEIGRS